MKLTAPKPHHLLTLAFAALLWSLVIVVESISTYGAYQAEQDHVRGFQMGALTAICAAIAFLGFGLAGRLKDDERRHVRARAKAARVVAVLFLFAGPIPFFGSALKMERLEREYVAYAASPRIEVDRAIAAQALLPISDRTSDDWEIQEAAARTVAPTSANLSLFDGELYAALIFQFLLIFASDALRVPAPITPEERMALMFKERGRKSAETRRRRKEAREKQKALKAVK